MSWTRSLFSNLSRLKGKHAILLLKIQEFRQSGKPVKGIDTAVTLEELTATRDNVYLAFHKASSRPAHSTSNKHFGSRSILDTMVLLRHPI